MAAPKVSSKHLIPLLLIADRGQGQFLSWVAACLLIYSVLRHWYDWWLAGRQGVPPVLIKDTTKAPQAKTIEQVPAVKATTTRKKKNSEPAAPKKETKPVVSKKKARADKVKKVDVAPCSDFAVLPKPDVDAVATRNMLNTDSIEGVAASYDVELVVVALAAATAAKLAGRRASKPADAQPVHIPDVLIEVMDMETNDVAEALSNFLKCEPTDEPRWSAHCSPSILNEMFTSEKDSDEQEEEKVDLAWVDGLDDDDDDVIVESIIGSSDDELSGVCSGSSRSSPSRSPTPTPCLTPPSPPAGVTIPPVDYNEACYLMQLYAQQQQMMDEMMYGSTVTTGIPIMTPQQWQLQHLQQIQQIQQLQQMQQIQQMQWGKTAPVSDSPAAGEDDTGAKKKRVRRGGQRHHANRRVSA